MSWRRYLWPVIGIAAVIASLLLLWHELRGISLDDVWDGIVAIPTRGWVLAALSSVVAYASLAGYPEAQIGNAPGKYIPNSPAMVASVGVTLGERTGWFGTLRRRYLASSPL